MSGATAADAAQGGAAARGSVDDRSAASGPQQHGKRRSAGIGPMAFTELWERFSFYGLQGILSFYLLYELSEGGLALPAAAAAGIVGAYGGAVYLSQLLGAWLGDRLVTPRVMVLAGGIIITIGHLILAFVPGIPGLAAGLIAIVAGTGALKTNITSIVGFLLDQGSDEHRDAGFSYFYMAINLGAVLGPLSTGFVQNTWGFHPGFALAAVGMLAALVQYVVAYRRLPERAAIVQNPLPRRRLPLVIGIAVAALVLVGIAIASGWLAAENLSTVVTILALIAAAAYFLTMCTAKSITRDERRRVLGYLPLFLAAGIYFGFLFQKFTAISILIHERVDLQVGDWQFPVAWITTMSPLSAVLITPLIARLWDRLGARQPGPAAKFAIGLIQIGCAYLFLLGITTMTGDATLPLALILLFMVFAGSSEVFVGPIGLSLASKIGPKQFQAQMVALNFLTLALGSSLSGQLGQLFTLIPNEAYFTLIAVSGIVLGGLLLVFRRPIQSALAAGFQQS